VLVAFIDQQRPSQGVESIGRLVPIAPSTYFRHKAAQADPAKRSARCRVRRLMRTLGLRGVVRGRAWTTTTQADIAAGRPADLVHRQFTALRPNQLWWRTSREVIRRKGPWRTLEAVEFATLAWVDWVNHRRLLGPIGFVPPAEYEARYYEQAAVA
jgi:transposase InsO family protein